MVSETIERKIEDIIFGLLPIPYADEEIIEVAEGILGADAIPGLNPIDLTEISTRTKILILIFGAVPVLDLEYLDLIGLNPFKRAEKETKQGSQNQLDDPEFDKTSSSRGSNPVQGTVNTIKGKGPKKKHAVTVTKGIFSLLKIGLPLILIAGIVFLFFTGSGYGALLGQQVGLTVGKINLEGITRPINEAAGMLKCFGNVACMRAWRANQTSRPGSEEVGQTFRLRIKNLKVNQGYTMNIGGRPASTKLPVNFLIENPRHGLKGINAKNVQYKLLVQTPDQEIICETKNWKDLRGEIARQVLGSSKNIILTGGFATPKTSDLNSLNLSSCGLLQPGFKKSMNIKLKVKYDYYTLSFINFRAMAAKKIRSNPSLRPKPRKSKSLDTPVQSYINVRAPVRFIEQSSGRQGVPFRTVIGVRPDRGKEYKIDENSVRFFDSSLTKHTSNCPDLQHISGNKYKLSSDAKFFVSRREKQFDWISNFIQLANCRFKLDSSKINTISRSGEVITFKLQTNYTLKINQETTFSVKNRLCKRVDYNCPMLVPVNQAKGMKNIMHTCDPSRHPDAANGCDARNLDAGSKTWATINKFTKKGIDQTIERGETVYEWDKIYSKFNHNPKIKNDISDKAAVGMRENIKKALVNNEPGIIYSFNADGFDDMEARKINELKVCPSSTGKMNKVLAGFKRNRINIDFKELKVHYFTLNVASTCNSSKSDITITEEIIDKLTGSDNTFSDYKDYCYNDANGALVKILNVVYCWSS